MKPLTATELLQVWEKSLDKSLIDKSMFLLSVACSVSDIKILTHLSIGDRDMRLFLLRKWMFGTRLTNLANCPQCGESMEWEMSMEDFDLEEVNTLPSPRQFNLTVEDYQLKFRLPNSHDLIKVMNNKNYQNNPNKILEDCILNAKRSGHDCSTSEVPEKVFQTLDEHISKEDPKANINILLNCESCKHQWETAFDIVSYLWTEIDNWAKHILQEVYTLARAFNWSEKDILEMSPQRRRMYLQMLHS